VKTVYTAHFDVDQGNSPDFDCAVQELDYGFTVFAGRAPKNVSREEDPGPLRLKLTNRAPNIVTVDWDHSAIVDVQGKSYHLKLYDPDPQSNFLEAIKKPPAPVIAPSSHIEVRILPEPRYEGQLPMFFLPPFAEEKGPIRVVLALSGGTVPHADCVMHATLVATREIRSTKPPWPIHGEPCLPSLGCAEGHECVRGKCFSPSKKGQPLWKRIGEYCYIADDCELGLDCQTGRCISR
jgi:hypothetical protein